VSSAQVIERHRRVGRSFVASGVRSFVREEGAGEPVVCIHGVPASSFLYRKVLGELSARGLRGIAFDLPGLGLAARPERERPNQQVRAIGHVDVFNDLDGVWTQRITAKYVRWRRGGHAHRRAKLRSATSNPADTPADPGRRECLTRLRSNQDLGSTRLPVRRPGGSADRASAHDGVGPKAGAR